MSVQAALVAYLKTVSAITTLVGTTPARIRPFERLQGEALPAITYFLVGSNSNHTWDGTSGLTRSRIQLDCWSDEHVESLTLAAAVKAATDGFTGTFASVAVQGCVFAGANPEAIERSADANTKWFRQSLDWIVWHN